MKQISKLSRQRTLKALADVANVPDITELRARIATFLFTALMKEVIGGGTLIFTFFDREHTYDAVYAEMASIFEEISLLKFNPVPGGLTDGNNYIRILTVDSIYEREYLVPIYECMIAAETVEVNPEAIDTTKSFLYTPEAQFMDYPWALQELLIHLDRPCDVKTLYCIPPEVEPLRVLIQATLEYAKLTHETVSTIDSNGHEQFEISAIDPARYGLLIHVMDKPGLLREELQDQLDALKAM